MKFELISKAGEAVTRSASRAGLVLKKFSPEILLGAGVVSIIGGTVLACKSTLKIDDVLAEHDEVKERMDKGREEKGDEYTEQDYKKDNAILTLKTGWNLVKLYAPAAGFLILGVACIGGSYGIMRSRNIALVAAYNGVQEAFKAYRDRVVDDVGKDKDLEYYTGQRGMTEAKVKYDENGKPEKDEEAKDVPFDRNGHSMYSVVFDESNPNWVRNAEYNKIFLACQQNYFNDRLRQKGHVFLNEVYDRLGFSHTKAGSIVGWVKGHGDDYIDFGIFNIRDEKARDFVNGYERSIWLDFNVDGPIYDMI